MWAFSNQILTLSSFALLVVSHRSLQFPTFFLSNDYKVILLVYQVFGRKSNYVWSDNLILWLLKMTCNDMGPLSPFCLILAKLSQRINDVGQLHICVVKTVAHCKQSSGIMASPAAPLAHRIGATSLYKYIFLGK